MKSILQWALDYYQKYEVDLKDSYPGINVQIFKNHLQDLIENYPGLTLDDPILNLTSKEKNKCLKAWKTGTPLAYVTGFSHFFDLKIKVNPDVLIPRFETEMILEMVPKSAKSVLDLCSGPGTIGLGLAAYFSTPLKIHFSDISLQAIKLCKLNAAYNRHQFHPSTIFNYDQSDCGIGLKELTFDVVVSNPPYIPESKKISVHPKVLEFEPPLALYLPDHEYDIWFEKYFKNVYALLKFNGAIIMEGHEDKIKELIPMMVELGFINVECLNDYSQRPRFIRAIKG